MTVYMKNRPSTIPTLKGGNAIPVIAVSTQGNTHLYPSISAAANDIPTLGASKRRTMSRRVSEGGGHVEGWYVERATTDTPAQANL